MIVKGVQKVYKVNDEIFHCGTAVYFHLVGGKWKSILLWYLRNGTLRFSELKKLIPDITDKMLSIQLTALESDDLIKRIQYGQKPPYRVQYSLTKLGESLIPAIEVITNWGINYAEQNGVLLNVEQQSLTQ